MTEQAMNRTTALVLMDDHIRWVVVPDMVMRTIGSYCASLNEVLPAMLAQIPVVECIVRMATEFGELLRAEGQR